MAMIHELLRFWPSEGLLPPDRPNTYFIIDYDKRRTISVTVYGGGIDDPDTFAGMSGCEAEVFFS